MTITGSKWTYHQVLAWIKNTTYGHPHLATGMQIVCDYSHIFLAYLAQFVFNQAMHG